MIQNLLYAFNRKRTLDSRHMVVKKHKARYSFLTTISTKTPRKPQVPRKRDKKLNQLVDLESENVVGAFVTPPMSLSSNCFIDPCLLT